MLQSLPIPSGKGSSVKGRGKAREGKRRYVRRSGIGCAIKNFGEGIIHWIHSLRAAWVCVDERGALGD